MRWTKAITTRALLGTTLIIAGALQFIGPAATNPPTIAARALTEKVPVPGDVRRELVRRGDQAPVRVDRRRRRTARRVALTHANARGRKLDIAPRLNRWLTRILHAETALTHRGVRWPIGGSRVVVAAKR